MVGLLSGSDKAGRPRIVVREDVLLPGFTPVELLHRETETQAIIEGVSPLVEGQQPENLFIYGVSGTGKTTCVKHALARLASEASNLRVVYVNCWRYYTRMAVYSLIVQALEEVLPRRGLATDEVFNRIIEVANRSSLRVIVILDEMDGLFFHKEEKLLRELAQAGDGKLLFGVIGVSSNRGLMKGRNDLGLRLAELEFKPYDLPQLAKILEDRAKTGLAPDSWDPEALQACAVTTFRQGGDVSLGLSLLRKAAKQAEKAGRTRLTVEDVEKAEEVNSRAFGASGKPEARLMEARFGGLSLEEHMLLGILKDGEKTSTAIYDAFCRLKIRTKRQIRNYLKALEAKRLIISESIPGNNPAINRKKFRLKSEVIVNEGRSTSNQKHGSDTIETEREAYSDCNIRSDRRESPSALIAGC